MNKIGFVILHYNVINETINCVNSIMQHIDTPAYNIVIVDNCSCNHTGEKLKQMYEGTEKVTVILNSSNMGFAQGNNVGYKYAVEKLCCDFVCILNNDTLIIQDDFFSVIREEYEWSRFGIMGPQIILRNGTINFLYYRFPNIQYFENELKKHKREYWQMKWYLNYPIVALKLFRNKIYRLIKIERVSEFKQYQMFSDLDKRKEDVILHGCCIIFSPEYIRHYHDAFDPRTFLYKEEELLYLRCKKANLTIVYNPLLKILHLEDVATNSKNKKRRNRLMFWMENQINSLEVLIEELKKDEQ